MLRKNWKHIKNFKVIHISTFDSGTGAGIAAHRINQALNEKGVQSDLVSLYSRSLSGDYVANLSTFQKLKLKFNNYRDRQIYAKGLAAGDFFTNGKYDCFGDVEWLQEYDFIHIHWVKTYISDLKVLQIIRRFGSKVIIHCHDSNFITGGCHVTRGCVKYIENCASCHRAKGKALKLVDENYRVKELIWKENQYQVIVPSEYMKEKFVATGKIESRIHKIPLPIDFKLKSKLRNKEPKLYNVFTILLGALNMSDPFKGGVDAQKAIEQFAKLHSDLRVKILSFGSNAQLSFASSNIDHESLGMINDEVQMLNSYRKADVFLNLSHEESFGQTTSESIFSGTPSIIYGNSGLKEFTEHKKNGYIVKFGAIEEVVVGLEYFLDQPKIEDLDKRFSFDSVANSYLSLYNSLAID